MRIKAFAHSDFYSAPSNDDEDSSTRGAVAELFEACSKLYSEGQSTVQWVWSL